MPPKTNSKPGCFSRMMRWGLGGLGLLIACGVVVNLVPPTDFPSQPSVTPTTQIEVQPTATEEKIVGVPTRKLLTFVEVQATLSPAPPTDLPAATPLPQNVVNSGANLRGGPGTEFPIVGGADQGQALQVVGMTPDRLWYQLSSGAWIAAFLVDNVRADVPVAASIPTVPVPPTATPVPVVVQPTQPPPPPPTPVSAAPPPSNNCDPSYPDFCLTPGAPDLDCGEIPYRRFRVYQPDPHGFDRDNDGIGCESG